MRRIPALLLMVLVAAPALIAQEKGLVAQWSFQQTSDNTTVESVSGQIDEIGGFASFLPGVEGTALRFDGYTTSVTQNHRRLPDVHDAFSVETWVVLNTYPWNWVPVLDEEDSHQGGYEFSIDAAGHFAIEASIDGVWQRCVSQVTLPLKRWQHIAATFDPVRGMTLYLNGKPAGRLDIHGHLTQPAHHPDLLIGRVRDAVLPACYLHPKISVWYSLDGLLDELKLFDGALSPAEVEQDFAAVHPPAGLALPWQQLPSGPPGAGTFGAFYTTLHYEPAWDRLWRLGPKSDVVVRFDNSPGRLVFWHGLGFIPAWVTENGKWYTDEFLEQGHGGGVGVYDAEPMSDKQTRYSHVNILESTPARVVVHWRYALADVLYHGSFQDPLSHWFDWADEYWTVYPDGIAVRKQVLHSSHLKGHEWQETIVVDQPGTRPEDNIQTSALTLENMQGETKTYSWLPHPPQKLDTPAGANIQIVNLKSQWKPFQIVAPKGVYFTSYRGEASNSMFEWWNHWPVALIPSSGRCAIAPDRAGHSSLSHIHWGTYSEDASTEVKLLMDGITNQPPAALLPLAESWLSAPALDVVRGALTSEGYDQAQRAYVLTATAAIQKPIEVRFAGAIYHPALVIHGWMGPEPAVRLDGRALPSGKQLRMGIVPGLRENKLVVWLDVQSQQPSTLTLIPHE